METCYNSIDEFILTAFPLEYQKITKEVKGPVQDFLEKADAVFDRELKKIRFDENGSGYVCPKCGARLDMPYCICNECGLNLSIYTCGYDYETLPEKYREALNHATGLAENGDYQDAIEVYEKLLDQYPNLSEAYNNFALTLLKTGETDRALDLINKALKFYPDNTHYLDTRGSIYKTMGKISKALVDYNAALSRDLNDSEKYYNRGNLRLQQKDYEKALDDFNKAIELSPNYLDAHAGRAITYFAAGDYVKANQAFDWLISQIRSRPQLYHYNAIALLELDESGPAITCLEKAIELYNPDTDARQLKECRTMLSKITGGD